MRPPYEVKANRTARADVLIALIDEHGWTKGAELGVEAGHTHLALLEDCPDLTLIGVDRWLGIYRGRSRASMYPELQIAVRPYESRSRLVRATTVAAAEDIPDGSLDFVFIDANHSEESVRADIEAWAPKLKPDGWITGHDHDLPGVRAAIDDLLPGHTLHPRVSKVWSIPLAETRYAR